MPKYPFLSPTTAKRLSTTAPGWETLDPEQQKNFHELIDSLCKVFQEQIDDWLEEQPIAYGQKNRFGVWVWSLNDQWDRDTHKARVVCIEPLTEEERIRGRTAEAHQIL